MNIAVPPELVERVNDAQQARDQAFHSLVDNLNSLHKDPFMQQLVKVAAATGRTIDLEVQLEGARNSGMVRFRVGSDGNVETNFKLLEPQQTSDPSDDERQIETSVECALPLLRRIGVHERGKTAIDKLAQELAKQIEREAGRVLQDLS